MTFVALTEGISMALLLPLLSSLGVPASEDKTIINEYFDLLISLFKLDNSLLTISFILIITLRKILNYLMILL